MEAEIITIGDELLIGQVINSNSAMMGKMLQQIGIKSRRMVTVADSEEDIISAIDNRFPETKLIIFSGGIGPTRDDLTKETLCKYFETELVFNQEAYNDISKLFKNLGFEVTENNRLQAFLPKDFPSLPNKFGTARGMWFEKDDLVVVSLPGVPYELRGLMENEVLPRLEKHFQATPETYRTVMITGIGESFLSAKIAEWEDTLPKNMKLAYLPQPGIVRLRITSKNETVEASLKQINEKILKLSQIIPDLIYGYDEIMLEEKVGQLLQAKNLTLATAESCTGGYIGHLITSISGSSTYFQGGIISYSNQVKIEQLNVSPSNLEKFGAVSNEVVREMAEGARKNLKTDFAISTSGVAGPNGGTEEKPVGTVWIAVAGKEKTVSKKFNFGTNRERNIRKAALAGLNMLREELIEMD